MKISKRLGAISDFIPDNSFILDIGCDHALLDIYCVKTKENVRAIASDINKGPLKQAKENIKKYNAKNITLSLGDGLSSYQKGVDTIVISGLGSTTIVDILKKNQNKLQNIKRLVISSNNDYYYLRKSISKLGFIINDEKIIVDKGKYYPIISFIKGKKRYNKKELLYGPILLKEKNNSFLEYISKEKEKLVQIDKKITKKHIIKKLNLKNQIKRLINIGK